MIEIIVYVNCEKTSLRVEYNDNTLDLSERKITDLCYETVFPEDIKKLDLSCNDIIFIDNFRFPESLEELDISDNQIMNIDGNPKLGGKFRFPKNLKKLDISSNYIKHLDGCDGTFRFPDSLKILEIWDNEIEHIDGNPEFGSKFRFPSNLEELHIYLNNIENIDGNPDMGGIFRLPKSLKRINISHNKIKTLPVSLIELENLTSFECDGSIPHFHDQDYYNFGFSKEVDLHPLIKEFLIKL